jgi:4-amino-4-deoxy-L-arabinose transferase-like glycosyltransferase
MVGLDPPLPLPDARPSGGRRLDALFLGVVCLFCAWIYAITADLPASARDQVPDMALALRMSESGALSDGNRHPLLPALLAPFAKRDPRFMVSARLVALAATAASLLLVYVAAARVFSRPLALLSAFLFLFELRFHARRIAPEPILAGLLALSTSVLVRPPGKSSEALGTAVGGALLGLAWLAKGTALLSVAAALLWLVFSRGRRAVALGSALVAGFVAAAIPLLAFNAARYGSPLYNANTTHVMWEDGWDSELDRRTTATPGSWLERHDLGDAARRLATGLVRQKGVEWPYGFLLLVLFAALVNKRCQAPLVHASRDPPREWRRLAVWSCLVWVPPLAWYVPIVASRRFLFALVPILLPPALDLVGRWLPTRALDRARAVALRAALPLGAVLVVAGVALALAQPAPDPARHLVPGTVEAAAALPPRAHALAKPSRTAPPDWLVREDVRLHAIPAAVEPARALDWIRERFDVVLLSSGLLAQRREALAPLARWDDAEGVVLASPLPPGFSILWRDPAQPSRFALLEVTSP